MGRAFCDVGIITHRNPDTVRSVDVVFYDNGRLPGEIPVGYIDTPPNVLFEIVSPFDHWAEIHTKTAEYLGAGVELVCVLVPETAAAHLHFPDRPGEIRRGVEELTLPAPLSEFRPPVSVFFGSA